MKHQSPNEQEIIDKSVDPELCRAVLSFSKSVFMDNNIRMTDVQWLSFVSHVSGMVTRSTYKEPIQSIEQEVFSEVSEESIVVAKKICQQMNHLQEDEKYLLSIHIEVAKFN